MPRNTLMLRPNVDQAPRSSPSAAPAGTPRSANSIRNGRAVSHGRRGMSKPALARAHAGRTAAGSPIRNVADRLAPAELKLRELLGRLIRCSRPGPWRLSKALFLILVSNEIWVRDRWVPSCTSLRLRQMPVRQRFDAGRALRLMDTGNLVGGVRALATGRARPRPASQFRLHEG